MGSSASKETSSNKKETLIDFSDRDDEFLDKDLVQKLLSWAIISAVLGFCFSFILFVGRKTGPASTILDRQAAEGAVVAYQKPQSSGQSTTQFGAGSRPRIRKKPKATRPQRPAWKALAAEQKQDGGSNASYSLAKMAKTSPTKTSPKSKVLKGSMGKVPEYKRSLKPAAVKRTPKKARPKPSKGLVYPPSTERPLETRFSQVEARVKQNLIQVLGAGQELGVGIDREGRALLPSDAVRAGPPSVLTPDGRRASFEVLATDGRFGLSLVRVAGASFPEMPLSPGPPERGERLLGFVPHGRNGKRSVRAFAGESFTESGTIVEAALSKGKFGSPLFNNRGELVLVHNASLPLALGSGIHLAADSAVVHRLARGYSGNSQSPMSFINAAKHKLGSQLAELDPKPKRGRILAGASLSDYRLGMHAEEAENLVSGVEKKRVGDAELWTCLAPPVKLFFIDDQLAMASTEFNGFATEDGLSVGADVTATRLRSKARKHERFIELSGLEIWFTRAGRVSRFVLRQPKAQRGSS